MFTMYVRSNERKIKWYYKTKEKKTYKKLSQTQAIMKMNYDMAHNVMFLWTHIATTAYNCIKWTRKSSNNNKELL